MTSFETLKSESLTPIKNAANLNTGDIVLIENVNGLESGKLESFKYRNVLKIDSVDDYVLQLSPISNTEKLQLLQDSGMLQLSNRELKLNFNSESIKIYKFN